ncbi:mediator of RNA polymerase II transcription subunit 12, partial [Lingula anatina]|uniref:Mediator of RNA polymerase II transcription subunit 12 n=1 Tax=Lingula anatina TaxID=7574 RepID=A0A1S3JB66_LINAN
MLVYMINKRRLRILLLVIPTVLAYFLYVTVFTASDDFNATHKPHVEKSWDEKIKSHHLHGLDLHGGPLHNHADAIAAETGKGKEQSKKGQMVEKEGGRDSKKENYSSGKKGALNLNGRGFDVLQRTDEVEDERESRNGVVKETQKTVLKEQKEEEEIADEISKHENEMEHVQMEQLEGKGYVQNPSSNLLLTTRKSLPPKGIQYKGGLPSLHYASHQDLQQQPVEKQIQQNNFRSETTKATMQQRNPFEGQPDIPAASHTHLNMSILKPDSMNKNIILNATIKNDTSPKDKTDENSLIQHHESDAPHNGQIQQHLSETQKSDSQQQKLVLQGRQQQSGFQQHPVPQLGSHQLPSNSQFLGSVQQNIRNQASDQQAAMKGQNQAENGTRQAYMQQSNIQQEPVQKSVNQPRQQPNVQQQLGQQLVNQPGQQPNMEGQEGQQLVNQPGQQPNVQPQEGQQLANQPGQQPNVQPQEGQQLANQPGQQPNVQLQDQQLVNQPGQQPNVQPQEGQQLVNQPGQQPNVQPQEGQQLANQPGQQPNVQLQDQQLVNQPGQQPNVQPQEGQQLVNQPGQQPNVQPQEGQQLVNQPGQQPNVQPQEGQQLVNQPGQQPNAQLQAGQQIVNQLGQQPNVQLQAGQQLANQPGQQPNVQLQGGQQQVNQPGQQPNVQGKTGQQLVNQPGQQPNVQLQDGQQLVHQPAQKAASQHQQQEVPQGQEMPQTGGLGGAPKSATNAEQVLIIADSQYPLPDLPAAPSTIPNWVPVENYIFTATQKEMPINSRYLPTIGNGHVGTVVYSDAIYMNGLYNGRLTSSHRARIPSSCAVNITAVEPSQGPLVRLYALNVAEGVFTQVIRGKGYNITQKMYAHRAVPQLLVVEVEVQRDGTTGPNKISLNLNSGTSSSDISYKDGDSGLAGVKYIYGQIKETELPAMTPTESHVFYTEVPRELVVPPMVKKMKWVSITSASYSKKDAEDGFQL